MTDTDLTETLMHLELLLASRGGALRSTMLSDLLTDDFREFGRSGAVWTKQTILPELAKEDTELTLTFRDFSVQLLSENIALVTYLARRTIEGQADMVTNRSSIWRQDGDKEWRMVFHQGTKAA